MGCVIGNHDNDDGGHNVHHGHTIHHVHHGRRVVDNVVHFIEHDLHEFLHNHDLRHLHHHHRHGTDNDDGTNNHNDDGTDHDDDYVWHIHHDNRAGHVHNGYGPDIHNHSSDNEHVEHDLHEYVHIHIVDEHGPGVFDDFDRAAWFNDDGWGFDNFDDVAVDGG